jgi:Ca2+-binding EF-hand superfamily protein
MKKNTLLLLDLNSEDGDDDDEVSNTKDSGASSPAFSYFSIASSKIEETPGLSSVFSCMKSSLRWKASLLKKRERESKPVLTEEDIEFLTTNTNFSEQEITEWFREFIMDCPEGNLTIEKVREMMNFILPDENGGIVTDLIFSSFDKDNNGSLDFCEFIIATHCTANSSPEDKLHWVFQMYDKDGSGSITIGEMIQVFATLYENEGVDQKMAVDRAEQIFGSLDVNNDGDITEEEFVKGCMEDEEMVKLLSDTSAEAPLVKNISACTTPTGMVTLETLNDSRYGSRQKNLANSVKTLNI